MEVKLTGQPSSSMQEDIATPQNSAQIYTLCNQNGTRLTITNRGASVMSLMMRDKNGIVEDVVLGYDDPQYYMQDEYYMGGVVGRYANRIAGDTVFIDNVAYKIPVKQGGYHLHGGLIGFNKKLFAASPLVQTANGTSIIFRYTSPHLEEGFPGQLELQVTYSLDEDDRWTVEYAAICNKTTLINLTQHTYFNLSGNPTTSIDQHSLQIGGNYYLPVNALQVPTGKLANAKNTVFDFSTLKPIGADIHEPDEQLLLSNGYDHSFVLEQTHTSSIKHAATVKEPLSGRCLNVYTTEPAVHFYSGNFLHNIKGKQGQIYNERAGFCLETQHFPDAPNQPHFPSTVLPAGQEFYSKTIFQFSAE